MPIKLKRAPAFLAILMLITGCTKPEPDVCPTKVIVNEERFAEAPNDVFNLKDAWIENDCLVVLIQASGCSGNDWHVELIDSGSVIDTNPLQRVVRISLFNEEACQAHITKRYSFDIRPLRVPGAKKVTFQLGDQWLEYNY